MRMMVQVPAKAETFKKMTLMKIMNINELQSLAKLYYQFFKKSTKQSTIGKIGGSLWTTFISG